MHLGVDSPLVSLFQGPDVPRDVRLLAARGLVVAEGLDRLALLALLTTDADGEVAATAGQTVAALPPGAVQGFIARPDVPDALRVWYTARLGPLAAGLTSDETGSSERRLADRDVGLGEDQAAPETAEGVEDAIATAGETEDEAQVHRLLTSLPVPDKVKIATLGRREQRAILIRDPNRVVATAVLASPKLTETEIENFARMQNVSEEVLRIIGTSRAWTKNYAVVAALVKNPRTPPAVSLPLVARLQERDVKGLTVNRNIPESVRLAARKFLQVQQERRG